MTKRENKIQKSGQKESELEKAPLIKRGLIDIQTLKPNNLNAIVYGSEEDTIEGLARSIQLNGLLNPIVINSDHKIISGHLRWQAYKLLDDEDQAQENPTGDYKQILSEIRQFDESVISEDEYFLIANEGRSHTPYQQLCEMERWSKLLQKPKYSDLSTGEKRDIIIRRVGFGSEKSYYRVKKALDYIEELRLKKGAEARIAKLMKRFEGESIEGIERVTKQEMNKPSPESLMGSDLEDLEAIISDFNLAIDLDDYESDSSKMKGLRKAIAEALDIDLDEKAYKKDLGEAAFTYKELLRMNKYELFDLVERYSLDVNIKPYKQYLSPLFLCREVSKAFGIEIPDLSPQELVSLNLEDLVRYAKQQKLGLNLKGIKDPYLYCLKEVGAHFKIAYEDVKTELSKSFTSKKYQRNFRSIPLGKMKMLIRNNRNKKLQKIEVLTKRADKNTTKLAELISRIDSNNLDELLAIVRSDASSSNDT